MPLLFSLLTLLTGVLLASVLSLLAALVSAGGDRAVAVTTIAFQYFGMHVFFYLCTECMFYRMQCCSWLSQK